MEHIVQFAIGIDDEAIKKTIKERAESDIIDSIKKDVAMIMFESSGYSCGTIVNKNYPKPWVLDIVKSIIEEHKDQIIEAAIAELAKNMVRTKAVKEALAKVVDE